jgi:RecA-family ATPase
MVNYFQDFEEQIVLDPWGDQIYTLKDAYEPREPLRYVINGLFPESSLSIVYGQPGCLKSMTMGDAAICVAGGVPFLGREVIQSPILWIDLDNGKRRTHERVEALGRAHDLSEDTPFFYISMPTPWLDAGKLADVEGLEKRIKSLKVKFVVIDNLGLISPSADENSDAMIIIMGHLRLLAEHTGAAIILIHHQRKSNGNKARAGESLRGHSSIEGSLDLALRIDREPDSNFITIQSTKTRDMDVPFFGCEFRYEHKPGTFELAEACFSAIEIEDRTSDKAIEKTIISVVRSEPLINQKELINEAKSVLQAGEKRIRQVLASLVKNHHIKIKEGARNAKLYIIE